MPIYFGDSRRPIHERGTKGACNVHVDSRQGRAGRSSGMMVQGKAVSCMDFRLSRLALGNVRDAQGGPPVEAILNISEYHYPTDRIYRNLYFPDGTYIQPLDLIGECTEFIHEQVRQGRRILVHCAEGISRSCVIGAAYLYECGMSLDEAIALIRSKRPIVNPSPFLIRALRDYYRISD